MFLIKAKKSPYYQIIYEVNGKRTSYSTKTKNKRVADKIFLKSGLCPFLIGRLFILNYLLNLMNDLSRSSK